MLILLATATIIGSLIVEVLVRRFNSTYEIEWPVAVPAPENALAMDVLATLRRAASNMNGK